MSIKDKDEFSRLVIGVPEGRSFYVGDKKLNVQKVRAANTFKVVHDDGFLEKVYHVTGTREVEVLRNVFISCGRQKWDAQGGETARRRLRMASVVIRAPRHVRIRRENYDGGD